MPVDAEALARSRLMARVKGKHTGPELCVRRLAHRLGYRYRLHVAALPGSPDLVFPSRKLAIFVHGCFWHRHAGCGRATTPKSRTDFWVAKFDRNMERDRKNRQDLAVAGWRSAVIWECETKDGERLAETLERLLRSN